ncbi:MAG: hypothetical protein ACRCVN_02590 [Spirochaetia bacterium]
MKLISTIFISMVFIGCSVSEGEGHAGLGLSIDGLTIFGYENNQLAYHIKSQKMGQSINKDVLFFENFILQKIADHQIEGVYIASDVRYDIRENKADFQNANFEYHKGNFILNGHIINVDFGRNFLTAENAQVIRSDQKISGGLLDYDLITNQLILKDNVEGQYLGTER